MGRLESMHLPRTKGKYIGILELARKETEAARMDLMGKGILEPGGDDVFDRADEMFPPPPYDLSTLVSESILENPLPSIRRAERKKPNT